VSAKNTTEKPDLAALFEGPHRDKDARSSKLVTLAEVPTDELAAQLRRTVHVLEAFAQAAEDMDVATYPDTTRPKGSVIIDGGRSITKARTVKLSLKAADPRPYSSGVSKMRIKNAQSTWSKWLPYATRKDWVVSCGEGMKTVYVQNLHLMGNVSATTADSITYRP
jgi:hypothetical protein